MKNYIALGTAVMTLIGTPLNGGLLTECFEHTHCSSVLDEGSALLSTVESMESSMLIRDLPYFEKFVETSKELDRVSIELSDPAELALQYYNNQTKKLFSACSELAKADTDMLRLLKAVGANLSLKEGDLEADNLKETCNTMHTNMMAAYEMFKQYLKGASLDILLAATGDNDQESVQNDDSGVDAEEIST